MRYCGKGVEQGKFIAAQHNPNQFALGLKDACCVEPGCCILSGLGAPFGLTACWTRKAVLDKYAGGMQNYVCFQGYIPNCCCMDTSDMCRGSELGLCLEAAPESEGGGREGERARASERAYRCVAELLPPPMLGIAPLP